MKFGAAKDHPGLVLVTTLGTGIGTALIYRGVLIPNTELGHLELDGHDAETQAAASVRTKLDLSFGRNHRSRLAGRGRVGPSPLRCDKLTAERAVGTRVRARTPFSCSLVLFLENSVTWTGERCAPFMMRPNHPLMC